MQLSQMRTENAQGKLLCLIVESSPDYVFIDSGFVPEGEVVDEFKFKNF